MTSNDLFDFMLQATQEMAGEYLRIQKQSTEDACTAGDQGEENWASLFRDCLPSDFHIVTKGRILSHQGVASPQVDILILSPSYPKHLLNKKLYLAGGVLAAFECKNTLKSEHIHKALKNLAEIRKYLPKREVSPYRELNSPIIYGLLAHSHSWKGLTSTPIENVKSHLRQADQNFIKHPREMIDLICIADLATWSTSKISYLGPLVVPEWRGIETVYGNEGSVVTVYHCHYNSSDQVEGFTSIGALISILIHRMAWEFQAIRQIAQYFRLADLEGASNGKMRIWSTGVCHFFEREIGSSGPFK